MIEKQGKPVYLICARYIYAGVVQSVSDGEVHLSKAQIVYETGAWSEKGWRNAVDLPGGEVSISLGAIESCGVRE